MGDINEDKRASNSIRVVGCDEEYAADVFLKDGIKRLQTESVAVVTAVDALLFLVAENNGSSELAINASLGSPEIFEILAPTSGPDYVITELRFYGYDNGIKIDNFLAKNSPIDNGIVVEINTNGSPTTFLPIKSTADFNAFFSFGGGARYEIIVGSGNDFMASTFSPRVPFKLQSGSSDKITVKIQDNLSQTASLQFIAFGYKDV